MANTPRYVGFIDPPYNVTLTDDSGAALDLTGCVSSSFTLTMLNQNTGLAQQGAGVWTVANQTTSKGQASYQWTANDMALSGPFMVYTTVKLPAEPAPREFDPELLYILPGTVGAGAAPVSVIPPPPLKSAYAINVKDTTLSYGGTVINAIGDGASHPLSGIFPTLAAAQTVFPGATALTDEIDYWVIQTYLVDGQKVYCPKGKYVLHGALSVPNGFTTGISLIGEGKGVTILTLRNSSQSNASVLCSASRIAAGFDNNNAISTSAATSYRLTMRDLTIDGNKSHVTSTPQQTYGIGLDAQADLTMNNVEVQNVNGWGVQVQGTSLSYTERGWYRDVSVHDNAYWGMYFGFRYRKVHLSGCVATNNGTSGTCGTIKGGVQIACLGGFFLDCSEMQVDGIQAHGNNGDGIFIRNVFACQYNGLKGTYNGGAGIHVLGMVNSNGASWLAENNGTNPGNGQNNQVGGGSAGTATGAYDLYFDDSTYGSGPGNYGVTDKTVVAGVRAGVNASSVGTWAGAETYGIYVDTGLASSALRLRGVHNSSSANLPAGTSTVSISDVLNSLADVSTTAPSNGQSLVWDSTNSVWKPVTVSAGGSPFTPSYTKITASGTWTVPATGTFRVRVVGGGGGGGGGGGAQASQAGGGGGAAAIAVDVSAALTLNDVYTVTIGAGGTAGAGATGAGATAGTGGTSTFTGAALTANAAGGGGGQGAAANSTTTTNGGIPGITATGTQRFQGFGGIGGSGGNTSGGSMPNGSQGGGAGASASASLGGNGGPAGAYTSATSAFGTGNTGTVNGGTGSSAAANTGHGGGGGGGAFTAGTGGTGGVGGSGYVEIWQIA